MNEWSLEFYKFLIFTDFKNPNLIERRDMLLHQVSASRLEPIVEEVIDGGNKMELMKILKLIPKLNLNYEIFSKVSNEIPESEIPVILAEIGDRKMVRIFREKTHNYDEIILNNKNLNLNSKLFLLGIDSSKLWTFDPRTLPYRLGEG